MREKRMLISLAMIITILVASTFVAYVMFNILESSAEASLQNWKFGGAFAGFAFTLLASASLASQFYKQMTFDEISTLRNQIHELSSKLIRGAPCPEDYVPEVDEKYKIVFARPKEWSPKRGILFQYEDTKEKDIVSSYCSVSCFTKKSLSTFKEEFKIGNFDEEGFDVDQLYNYYSGWITSRINDEVMSVRAQLGISGEIESRMNVHNEVIHVDNLPSRKVTYDYEIGGIPAVVSVRGFVICTFVPSFKGLYLFAFSADSRRFSKSSEIFNAIVGSIRFLP